MGDPILFILMLALTVSVVGALGVHLLFQMMEAKRKTLQERLGTDRQQGGSVYGPLVRDSTEEENTKSEWLKEFSRKLHRAYPGVVMRRYFTLVFALAMFAFVGGIALLGSVLVAAVAAALAVGIPFWRVSARCKQRVRMIDEQLPDALDFLARILRAGHSLTTGFQMAADELPDPLASEFRQCHDQHSLGTPMEKSMRDMAERVGTSDFAFFVTAVLIQRQTGGDLGEVLTNIANMTRARLRLQSHVHAITAQGRLVGTILLVMPIVLFLALYMLNPIYAGILINSREGVTALGIAAFLQFAGFIWIRRIVAVEM